MMQVLTKKNLPVWLEQLAKECRFIAPVRVDSLKLFSAISKVEDIVLDFDNTTLSPKEWFFPATETLFTLERRDGTTELIPAAIGRKSIIFGIRPCDALGLSILDKPFLADPADATYHQHRDMTTLIGIACSRASPECFCTSMNSAPDDASNMDILLTQVNEGYSVKVVTEKGKALLASASLEELEAVPAAPPSLAKVPAEGISHVMRRVFDAPYWSRLADRCIHCNLCAYVCPCCYCFDIRDYMLQGKVERIRTWESCQSPGFTRVAGGYDPRSTKGAKLRQRFYHKLVYMPEQFNIIGCCGCGRCVTSCPVNIDIREIITDIQNIGARSVA
jgi:sulfhydrogenase subunit beta (sulfur reductase)